MSDHEKGIDAIVGLLLMVPTMFLRAAVLQQVWVWFLPWPVPGLKPIIAVGSVAIMFTSRTATSESLIIAVLGSMGASLFVLFVAWCCH